MPKIKTHKGAAARFRFTGSGKLVRRKGLQSHLRRKKPKSVKRLYAKKLIVHPADVRRIKRTLPNGLP